MINKTGFGINIALIILISMMVIISGCRKYQIVNSASGCKTFIMNNGIGKFSFEYSNKYQVGYTNVSSNHTNIYLNGPDIGEERDFTFINVTVTQLEPEHQDFHYYLENHIRTYSAYIKTLQRFPICVANETGEEVVFNYDQWRTPFQIARGVPETVPSIIRNLAFTHNNLLWWIEMNGLKSSAESDKADFEHVIQTFKILE